jgi:hypothetical protein
MKLHCGTPRPLNKTIAREEGNAMNKILMALALLGSLSTESVAQHAGTDQDEKACIHDVERLCHKWMDQGDFTILACLKENRTRLHPACRDVLIRHGQ